MAINRDQLIDKVLNGNATAATEFTSPKTPAAVSWTPSRVPTT